MPVCLVPLVFCLLAQTVDTPESAAVIMAKVAANVERANEDRTHYVYNQRVRGSLIRTNGQMSRKEDREYSVFPGVKRTEKKLVSFHGEYRRGKQTLNYSKPGFKYKDPDI